MACGVPDGGLVERNRACGNRDLLLGSARIILRDHRGVARPRGEAAMGDDPDGGSARDVLRQLRRIQPDDDRRPCTCRGLRTEEREYITGCTDAHQTWRLVHLERDALLLNHVAAAKV